MSLTDRIRQATVAFACADALGAPWEGAAPAELVDAPLVPLRAREDWPLGATSDDTAQLLLVAEVLAGRAPEPERAFLEALDGALAGMRGTGPTTRAAVARFRREGTLVATTGSTNGAAMRAPALGWAIADQSARRDLAVRLARTTHGAPGAVAAACAVAAMASSALEGRPRGETVALAAEEVRRLAGEDAAEPVRRAAAGTWRPPAAGISLDALETTAAVVHVLAGGRGVAASVDAAIRLGGDTDTVAAIAAGIAGGEPDARPPDWTASVLLPEAGTLDRLAAGLAARRVAGD